MKKRTLVLSLGALALMGGLVLDVTQAKAYQNGGDNHQNMIQVLAKKFGKSEEEVEAVFSEMRGQHREEVQVNFDERLDEALASGEINEEQKQLILNKRAELQEEFTAAGEQREAHREQIRTWAEENGIDMSYLVGREGQGLGRREGKGMGMGRMDN